MIERWKLSGKQIPYVQQKMLAQIKSWWLYTHLVNAKSCGNIKPPGRQCCKTHQVRARSVISIPAKTFNIHPKFKTTLNLDKLINSFKKWLVKEVFVHNNFLTLHYIFCNAFVIWSKIKIYIYISIHYPPWIRSKNVFFGVFKKF